MSTNARPINLALQGGGAHGAYAWGVVEHLLNDGRLHLNAITATSAGAMNAAVIAYGMHIGGPEGAKAKLEEFWSRISRAKESFGLYDFPLASVNPFYAQAERWFTYFMMEARNLAFSPTQVNPLGFNPLKDILLDVIDFDDLRTCECIKLFVSATNVRTGKVRVFNCREITVEALLASACLPQLYEAVEVDGEAYWDGGYMGNPSLFPLFYETDVRDLLVVHINPIHREKVPRSTAEISNRLNEITFNGALLREMRAIAFVQKLLREGWLKEEFQGRLSNIRFHSIEAEDVFTDLGIESKFDTHWYFLKELRDLGHVEAAKWLDAHSDCVGERDSVDLREHFLNVGGPIKEVS